MHSVLGVPRLHAPAQGGASKNQFAPHLDSIKLNKFPVRDTTEILYLVYEGRKLREFFGNVFCCLTSTISLYWLSLCRFLKLSEMLCMYSLIHACVAPCIVYLCVRIERILQNTVCILSADCT